MGENGETEVPSWLKKQLRDKHKMRQHYLGDPKTPKSRRTISISARVAEILEKLIEGKAASDFVFVSPTGLPVHNSDFYTRVWQPLMEELVEDGRHRPVPVPRPAPHARLLAHRRGCAAAAHSGAVGP